MGYDTVSNLEKYFKQKKTLAKKPLQQEADQLAIHQHDRGSELGSTPA